MPVLRRQNGQSFQTTDPENKFAFGWIGCQKCRCFINYINNAKGLKEAAEAWNKAVDTAIEAVEKLPAADAAPVKHGHWEEIRDAYGQLEGWMCKKCGREMKAKENYCPNCGAKMDDDIIQK